MTQKPKNRRQFGSDNYAGICPEAWQSLVETNDGHVQGYGDDECTKQAAKLIQDVFETRCEVFFVFNGTAANSLSLASMCQSYHAVLCHETAHVESDECGAPEFFTNGAKLIRLPGENGRIDAAGIERVLNRRSDVHFPKPRAVTLTQATEVGTVYTPDEIKSISSVCKKRGLGLHIDGARFANAAVSLGVRPKEITWQAGADVLSFGGTKNGTAVGDAVVFFNLELAREFDFRRKQAGQLASKMRFLSAPWIGMLRDGAWLRHAAQANGIAEYLEKELRQITQIKIMFPRQANSVFVELNKKIREGLWKKGWMFYCFIGESGCRLMCAWDLTREDVDEFVCDLKSLV